MVSVVSFFFKFEFATVWFLRTFRRKVSKRIVSDGRGLRTEHCRNLRIESVKIEFLRAQERIAPLWQTATLFSRPNENRVHSFRVAVCKRGEAWNAPKRGDEPFHEKVVRSTHEFLLRNGTINLGKCSRVLIRKKLFIWVSIDFYNLVKFICDLIISSRHVMYTQTGILRIAILYRDLCAILYWSDIILDLNIPRANDVEW